MNGEAFWINNYSFVNAPTGTFNTSRRDQVRDPGFENIDFSVFKTGNITERFKLQFRAEMFNLLNHVNFAPFKATSPTSTTASISTLGLINSTIGT